MPAIPQPSPPDEKLLGKIAKKVREIREMYKKRHIPFNFDDETGSFVNEWYVQNRKAIYEEKNELIQSAMQRLDCNTRKLALLYAILENDAGDNLIRLEQFKAALEVAEYWKKSMIAVFGSFAEDKQIQNEQTIIKRVTSKPRTLRELHQSTTRQMSAEQLKRAYDALLKTDAITLDDQKIIRVT